MQVGRIIGNIVCTQKDKNLVGKKMLVVQPVNIKGLKPQGSPLVALDAIGAGEGELVITVSGSSARLAGKFASVPVDTSIIGIIDSIDVQGKTIFRKEKEDN